MEKVNILIGGKYYKVELAQTDEDKEQGLQEKTELAPDEGMLFLFSEDDMMEGNGIWMKDTKIPLDIVFISDELNVLSVQHGVPLSEELLTEQDAYYVLEVNENSGIKVGDELEFQPKHKQLKPDKMLVLNSGGEIQMELEGEERIFSRANTKILIKFAKKAATTNNENDYKNLGKRVFKFLKVQETNNPEYVQSKNQ